MSRISVKIKRIFFPERCKLCGEIIPIEKDRCSCTDEKITRIKSDFCDSCGQRRDACVCAEKEVKLSHITAPFVYKGFIKSYIHAFKFSGKKNFSKKLGAEMAERFLTSYPEVSADIVTFVPAFEKSLKERGYNQSELLAKVVSQKLSVPFGPVLSKIKETQNQHKLSAAERKTNLEGAIEVIKECDVSGKTIIICDDIKTTGNTFRICSELLFEKGALDVYCLCAAISEYEPLPF